MFDLPDDKDEALRMAALVTQGLTIINTLVSGASAGNAASVLTIIKVIIASLQQGFTGDLTVDQVHAELKKLTESITGNDAAVDAALKEKFTK